MPQLARSNERGSIEIGSGIHVPLDGDERDVYDGGPGAFVAYTTRIAKDGRSRVLLEAGWLNGSGPEVLADPTFEIDDARYDLLQVAIGIRHNAVSDPDVGTAFWLGAGVLNVLSWWRDPLGARDSGHTMGFYLEISPQIPVGDHWRLWIRSRLQVVADVEYDNDYSPLDYDVSTLDAGVAYAWF